MKDKFVLKQYPVVFISLSFLGFLVSFNSCNPRAFSFFASTDTVFKGENTPHPGTCDTSYFYAPDENYPWHTPVKFVRVNFHFMRPSDGSGSYGEAEAYQYVQDLIRIANDQYLSNNKTMNLPLNNQTATLKTQYRYVLSPNPNIPGDNGVYFHDDDDLAYFNKEDRKNQGRTTELNKYGIMKDTVINVFMQEHFPDSVASPTYYASATGVGFSNFAKLAGSFQHSRDTVFKSDGTWFTKGPNWYAPLLNHELGHCLGLSHTWAMNDKCDDTPRNANCYNKSDRPPCNREYSNNVMDYNACQCAWTPCQLGIIHYGFFREDRYNKKKFLLETWCQYKSSSKIIIGKGEEVEWYSAKDLEGDIEIRNGAKLIIYCGISLPQKAKIEVKAGGTLVLDGCVITNSCGDLWEGIQVWKNDEYSGKVIVKNNARVENCNYPIIFNSEDN